MSSYFSFFIWYDYCKQHSVVLGGVLVCLLQERKVLVSWEVMCERLRPWEHNNSTSRFNSHLISTHLQPHFFYCFHTNKHQKEGVFPLFFCILGRRRLHMMWTHLFSNESGVQYSFFPSFFTLYFLQTDCFIIFFISFLEGISFFIGGLILKAAFTSFSIISCSTPHE